MSQFRAKHEPSYCELCYLKLHTSWQFLLYYFIYDSACQNQLLCNSFALVPAAYSSIVPSFLNAKCLCKIISMLSKRTLLWIKLQLNCCLSLLFKPWFHFNLEFGHFRQVAENVCDRKYQFCFVFRKQLSNGEWFNSRFATDEQSWVKLHRAQRDSSKDNDNLYVQLQSCHCRHRMFLHALKGDQHLHWFSRCLISHFQRKYDSYFALNCLLPSSTDGFDSLEMWSQRHLVTFKNHQQFSELNS